MSIKKQFLKSRPLCKVTFMVDDKIAGAADKVILSGDFNDWSLEQDQMTKQKNGTFKLTKELEVGKRYEFRYLINDQDWKNDPDADDFVKSGVSHDNNGVLILE